LTFLQQADGGALSTPKTPQRPAIRKPRQNFVNFCLTSVRIGAGDDVK
jgi:hypothetical protein